MTLDAERPRLTEALVRVTERSLFAFAEPLSGEMPAVDGGWYSAAVAFTGPFTGEMRLSVPETLARELRDASMGDDGGDSDAEVRDLVGEFANMVCGSWLTMLESPSCFALERPAVDRAEPAADPTLAFLVNEQPVTLSLECHGAPGM